MEIPSDWREALAKIQAIDPTAVLAGGCLRDLDNGRPVKDLDIFVRGTRADELDRLRERLITAGFDCAEIDEDQMYPVGDGNDVVGHFDVEMGLPYPAQVIVVDFPTDKIVNRFDYGICQLSFDGLTLVRTDEYERDKQDQVFRLIRDRQGAELAASVHRYARLVQKYEGWRFEPFELDDFAVFGV